MDRHIRALSVIAALGAGCSPHERGGGSHDQVPMASDTRTLLARVPEISARLADARAWSFAADGLHALPARESAPFRIAGTLEVVAPLTADGPTRLSIAGQPGAWLTLVPHEVEARPASTERGMLVYRAAAPGGDVALVSDRERFEELRVVHQAGTRWTFSYDIALGPAFAAASLRGGRVEILDREARVRIATEEPFAVDAHGVRRTATVALTERDRGATLRVSLDARGLVPPVVVDPTWVLAAATTIRLSHSATLLADGKVLVAGGTDANQSTAEVYDPANDAWTPVGNLKVPRFAHSALRLSDGKVLISGGHASGVGDCSIAELYDPSTNTFSLGPVFYTKAVAVELSDGRVFTGRQLWNRTTSTVTSVTGNLITFIESVHNLPSGDVLVAGRNYSTPANPQIWNPAASTWTNTPARKTNSTRYVAARIPSTNDIMFAGGTIPNASVGQLSTAERYDLVVGVWVATAPMSTLRDELAGAMLTSGRLLVVGGSNNSGEQSSAEVYDPPTNKWLPTTNTGSTRRYHTVTALPDGRALILGYYKPAQLYVPQATGLACGGSGDCTSGSCVDGVCCDTACAESCKACNLPSAVGTCTVVSGTPVGARTCGPYACNAGSCRTACASNGDCHAGHWCDGTTCVLDKPNGQTCSVAAECVSAHCIDGVCCDSACSGQCQACDVVGSVGSCVAVAGAPHGTRGACTASSAPLCAARCDGLTVNACTFVATSAVCSLNACKDGIEHHAATCNGAGGCNDVPKGCGAYACGAVSCKTACADDIDCVTGFRCAGTQCVPRSGVGEACTAISTCETGLFCVDAVCCATASCSSPARCDLVGRKGTCSKPSGASCEVDAECNTGFCADGVCCDRRCDGQCESCTASGTPGVCSPVAGAPRGNRTACATDPANACAAKRCDGKEPATCAAYVAAGVHCAASSCTDGVLQPSASCDGKGACTPPARITCAPFGCAVLECATTCSGTIPCAVGYQCADGACVPTRASCTPDRVSRMGTDGSLTSCAPYRCTGGACLERCAAESDCADGMSCRSDGACAALQDAASEGGCQVTFGRSHDAGALLIVLGLLVRRRRARGTSC